MQSVSQGSSIEGRLRNTRLPKSKVLLPLHECIINSIHAIEDNTQISLSDEGYIKVYIHREAQQTSLISEEGNFAKIESLEIIDNGIGFDPQNYKSFLTTDSTHKIKRGSKGLGHFLWLKAFDSVEIKSIYQHDGDLWIRDFTFDKKEGVSINQDSQISKSSVQKETTVFLRNFISPYRGECPQSIEVIGRRILEYCLPYFLLGSVPKITLYDGDELFCLNEYFERNTEIFGDQKEFTIGELEFKLRGLRFYRGENTEHTVFYCAHQREVLSESLASYIVDLESRKLTDDEERKFVYYACVYGDYLDDNVSGDRTKFMFDEVSQPLLKELGELSQQDIKLKVSEQVNKILEPYLEKIRSEKKWLFRHKYGKGIPSRRIWRGKAMLARREDLCM